MGRLDFSCLTSTPDSSTFYGLDTTNSFDDLPNSYRTGYSFVIFKSNSNPTSPANLTWSVVSRISVKYLKSVGWGDYSCVVNADGVFTSFFRNYTASSLPVPSGFQYDPFGLPGSDTLIGEKGPGTWRPFKVDPSYQWLKPYGSSQLSQAIGYVSSPAGPYLLHCMLSESTIQFARQEETNGVLTLTKVGGWNLPNLDIVSPSVITIGNDQLYVLFRTRMSFGVLNSYSLSSISSTLPANKTYLSPASRSCGDAVSPRLLTMLKTLYLVCDQPTRSPELYTIKDPDSDTTLGAPDLLDKFFWVPSGQPFAAASGGPGQPRFLLYRTTAGKFAVPLDGPNHTVVNIGDITVDDTSGSGIIYPLYESPSFTAEAVGSISAVVVVGFLAVFFYRRRKRVLSALKGFSTEAGTAPDTPDDADSKPTAPAGSNAQQQPEMSTPINGSSFPSATMSLQPTSTPTTILPMAPISSSNLQPVQNQMQALQFSQHPRPTVENIRSINNTPVASSSAWQPTPFVPPAGTQRIRAPEVTSSNSTPTNSLSPPPPIPHGSKPGNEIESFGASPTIHHPHT
ncbi:MAG: hypothetical protein JOS17DRAFT_746520 [Linnemannia elongata]|nr:MAG: hypothetical protein JOS17DRAFT_746520 [Linnemannia elongata]